MIIDRHGGAVDNVSVYLGTYAPDSIMDPQETLEKQGVIADAEQTLLYDFRPISHPLLTTPIGHTTVETSIEGKGLSQLYEEAKSLVPPPRFFDEKA